MVHSCIPWRSLLRITLVKPGSFRYLKASSAEEVVWALHEYADDAAILSGGQSLLPLLNMRMARPAVVVDVNGLKELDGISVNGALEIGALTRQSRVEHSREVAAAAPLVSEAVRYIGHPAIRNRGTVGGNIAHADSASELPAVMVALGAEVVALGADGERSIPADDFFVTHYTTALDRELVTGVRIPLAERPGTAFIEVARRHGDFALVGVAAALTLDDAGRCTRARIALSGVAGAPHRPREAESLLEGELVGDELLAEVERAVQGSVEPGSDLHASADYRRRVSGVIARRAVERAAAAGNSS
jgi:aerobic carbon-monoxide dehydrogenase medium subunit